MRGDAHRAPPRLAAVYESILDARFDRADELTEAHLSARPGGSLPGARRRRLWWQIQIDPENRARRQRDSTSAPRAAIAATDAWTKREPQQRGSLVLSRGRLCAARAVAGPPRRAGRGGSRDGNRIRDALERALGSIRRSPMRISASALYHYYADVAPAAAKVLRWLLFLPGGDRAKGSERDVTRA